MVIPGDGSKNLFAPIWSFYDLLAVESFPSEVSVEFIKFPAIIEGDGILVNEEAASDTFDGASAKEPLSQFSR